MTGAALALVIGAAVVHAAWNALAKRARDQLAFLWSAVTLATFLFLPVGFWWVVVDGFPPAALSFVIATIVLHALYFYALGRSYGSGDVSVQAPTASNCGERGAGRSGWPAPPPSSPTGSAPTRDVSIACSLRKSSTVTT